MRALVVVPVLKHPQPKGETATTAPRSNEAKLEEATGLARAIDLEIAGGVIVTVSQPRPATLMGTGKVAEIGELAKSENAGLIIVDHPLTPVQQRNLEREWKAKVIDRTGLILEIFGRRASTKEGTLQVELAHLNYQKGRLVRSWTHLERQRGGAGFMGGPGETQIEADRRILQTRSSSWSGNSNRFVARVSCTAPSARKCRIRSWRSSAIRMPANQRCSIGSQVPAFSPRTCCLRHSIRRCAA